MTSVLVAMQNLERRAGMQLVAMPHEALLAMVRQWIRERSGAKEKCQDTDKLLTQGLRIAYLSLPKPCRDNLLLVGQVPTCRHVRRLIS